MPLQYYLLVLLPILTPLVGSSVAAIIAQRGWPAWFNDGLAWFLLLSFAGLDMWANSAFAGGWFAILADAFQTITLLSSGWLVKLDPWLAWLSWLQANVFDIVPLLQGVQSPPKITPLGTRAYVPSGAAQTPPQVPGVPPRASAGQQDQPRA